VFGVEVVQMNTKSLIIQTYHINVLIYRHDTSRTVGRLSGTDRDR